MPKIGYIHCLPFIYQVSLIDKMLFLPYIAKRMRKEVLFAIVAGLVFGLIIAFGVWRINFAFKPQQNEQTTTQDVQEDQGLTTELKITIAKPEEADVIQDSKVTISGITKPNSWVVLSSPKGDYLTKSATDGVFTEEISLESALNNITAIAVGTDGSTVSQKLNLVYSTELKLPKESPTNDETSTDESGIRQKVEQQVEEALNKPKAYIGTVTDFADSTIQIKSEQGEIMQISAKDSEDITVVKITDSTKVVTLSDVAIGDFIVAMGIKNENDVLVAQRILITSPTEDEKLSIYLAKVTDVTTRVIDLTTTKDKENLTISLDKNTDVFNYEDGKASIGKASDLDSDLQIILVATGTPEDLTAQSIFILQ
ncbi:hypothetical protein ACFL1Q_00460 [Patescibacteria group bacterium]